MSIIDFRTTRFLLIAALAVFLLQATAQAKPKIFAGQKMTAGELIAKHLETIGTADARAAVRTRVISGNCKYRFRSGIGEAAGDAVLASEGPKSLIAMIFGGANYPYEKIAFDGKDYHTADVTPGIRSILGGLLRSQDVVFREGLIGGTLSTSWALLDQQSRGSKLEYAGTKKVEDHELYELKYTPHKGSDLRISLFFDHDTFQHVRTQYQLEVPTQTAAAGIDALKSGLGSAHYIVVETFSDFKKEKRLTLPHVYKIQYTIDSPQRRQVHEWELNLNKFTFNQIIDPAYFNLASAKS